MSDQDAPETAEEAEEAKLYAMMMPLLLSAAKAVLDEPYLRVYLFQGSALDRLNTMVALIEGRA